MSFRKLPSLEGVVVVTNKKIRSITGAELCGVRLGWRTKRKQNGQNLTPPREQRFVGIHKITLPKFNIAPKNDGFQEESPFPGVIFRCHVSFREGSFFVGDCFKDV